MRSEIKAVGGGRKVGVLTVKLFSKDTAEDVRYGVSKASPTYRHPDMKRASYTVLGIVTF